MNTLIIIGVIVLVFIWAYNSLIAKKNEIKNTYGSIDAVLKKRYDLIPNLIAAVQEYMDYEKSTLTQITELRTQAINAEEVTEKFALNDKISDKIQSIMVSVEDYPELQSSQNMLQLQQALAETEGQISAARRTYNQAVTNYNNACEQIPTNFIASFLRYELEDVLETPEIEKANINVREAFRKNR